MSACVIVGGAEIKKYDEIKKYLSADDFYIFCDCGLNHLEKLGVKADLIVGDFDSHKKPDTDIETIVLPCEKDDTDTVFAIKEAIKRGYKNFILIGVVGGRFDHTLGNISILMMLENQGLKGKIIDDFSEMEIVSQATVFVEDKFAYFSLLNISGEAEGVTIKNAKYPLENAEIKSDYPIGVSNEVIKGKTAEISVKNGQLLLIKIRQEAKG
ncbi:MAG: thiamine diphosphokinase [Clostridia bacterium]|nr:thiamine diphosphokinase [Clostridia bacterium]